MTFNVQLGVKIQMSKMIETNEIVLCTARSRWTRDIAYILRSPNKVIWNVVLPSRKNWARKRKPTFDRAYRLTWQRYHRLSDHMEFHDYLQKEFPNMVQVVNIGTSVEGRQMRVLKISSGQPNAKAVWIDGGTHAREWISPASVSYIVSEFVENRAAHGPYVAGVDLYVAPFVNPDGYEYSHAVDRLWRKNRKAGGSGTCAGTDLNRNYGYKWGGAGSSRQPCKEIYAGNRAFSEPETAAISRFVLANKDKIKAYVTFHSYGQYILYPWGYDRKVPPDYADLDRVGRKMARAIQSAGGPSYTVGNSAATLYAASGGADDWAKGAAGIKYTYTIELRDNGAYGFVLPAQFIEPTARDAMAAIKVIAEEVYNLP
ncbi:carboxypeptidase B isoform X3 [Nilaparvata lugens]|uniref:Carboxypeptidase B n=1 Tax=Nilaparvata lugens TaxID=108931 RepID=A0A7T9KRE1_NILLU|nr:carboxypeptidase B isoform X3 [Nilaparvata lugens]QQS74762.1 carboxypeptidase B [Nilaparvata lugens]